MIVALWSVEALHTLRLREVTFRSICPDTTEVFRTWWDGGSQATRGSTSSLILFDPLPGERSTRRRWVGLEDLRKVDPRYRGYAGAMAKLRFADAAWWRARSATG